HHTILELAQRARGAPKSMTPRTASAVVLVALGVLCWSCGGSQGSAVVAPTRPAMQLSITVSVANLKVGSAAPSDFVVSITTQSTPMALMATDGGPVIAALAAGMNYAVGVTGPAGYDVTLSGACSGTSAVGTRDCTVALKESAI